MRFRYQGYNGNNWNYKPIVLNMCMLFRVSLLNGPPYIEDNISSPREVTHNASLKGAEQSEKYIPLIRNHIGTAC